MDHPASDLDERSLDHEPVHGAVLRNVDAVALLRVHVPLRLRVHSARHRRTGNHAADEPNFFDLLLCVAERHQHDQEAASRAHMADGRTADYVAVRRLLRGLDSDLDYLLECD